MSALSLADRELLSYACKAAGRIPHDIDEHGAWFRCEPDPIIGAWSKFNPLVNNGDAFVLAVQLHLNIGSAQFAKRADGTLVEIDAPPGSDACAAVRRAIVYHAATLGGYKP